MQLEAKDLLVRILPGKEQLAEQPFAECEETSDDACLPCTDQPTNRPESWHGSRESALDLRAIEQALRERLTGGSQ